MTATALTRTDHAEIADIRTLRLAVGLALAFGLSQAIGWPASFISAVLTSVLLALPTPGPTLKTCISFVLVMAVSLAVGIQLLPLLHNQPGAGVVMTVLAMFWAFYFGARGGPPILAAFLLVGVTLIPVAGSESIDVALVLLWALAINAVAAFVFIWLAFALFPDPPAQESAASTPPIAPRPNADLARRSALRSTLIVLPVLLWLLASSETSSYAIVLLKIATLGQQSSLEKTSSAANDLLLSTIVGGIAAIIIWNALKIWPNLFIFSLLFLLCGLFMGRRIFAGAGLAPRGSMWSYGLLTTIIIIVPATMDTAGGDAAGGRFADRIVMFLLATLYAVAAAYVFDRFWPGKARAD
ncbi:MAG: DUF2955 domain-containing protein [Gammaproteobacteria bacterium]|nr:DUF2955 domain-containing protein [Gammaproteobacteria bacterium]MBT8443149.1 DUF2955 domain-containing protein [Gammaproteobacteria bacterium]